MLVVKNKCNMVELSFLKSGSKYICEFEVSSDFNLHVEREKGGYLYLYQRSSEGGNYDSVDDAKFASQDLVVDYDCSALVYPKYIKIVSEVEPSYAAITTDGEITEIKSQTKEVEVTANGTTQVAPDAGYSYLTGVTIKTNVPQSGGSGEGSSIEYLDVSGLEYSPGNDKAFLLMASFLIKAKINNQVIINTYGFGTMTNGDTVRSNTIAIAVDFSTIISNGAEKSTLGETISLLVDIDSIPRITKEEFYTI